MRAFLAKLRVVADHHLRHQRLQVGAIADDAHACEVRPQLRSLDVLTGLMSIGKAPFPAEDVSANTRIADAH